MADEQAIRDAFRWQAAFARRNASPVTERLCDALADRLDRSSELGRRVLGWAGDPIADALSLRVTGGLHALVRAGQAPALAPVYGGKIVEGDAVWCALQTTIALRDQALVAWLAGPPQTNEPGRSAVLMAGLLVLASRFHQPFELLEIGSSAGLNLMIDRYGFDLGGVPAGPATAPLTLRPEWRGPAPPRATVRIGRVAGVDIAPIDVRDDAEAARLIAYVWPDQADRLARVEQAIEMARAHPPLLDRGDAADWIEARFAEDQADGTTRVLMHSIVWQYLPDATRARIERAMARAGRVATRARPLAWLAYEGERDLNQHGLVLRVWPGDGRPERLATAHPHGAWIAWEKGTTLSEPYITRAAGRVNHL